MASRIARRRGGGVSWRCRPRLLRLQVDDEDVEAGLEEDEEAQVEMQRRKQEKKLAEILSPKSWFLSRAAVAVSEGRRYDSPSVRVTLCCR